MEPLLTRTLGTWVYIPTLPLMIWMVLCKPLKLLGLGHLIYQSKGWNRKIMNGVFLVSSPSFTLILQRWLFFSREVNDESGPGGPGVWRNGAGRPLQVELVQWAPTAFFQSCCSMKNQQNASSLPFEVPHPHVTDNWSSSEFTLLEFNISTLKWCQRKWISSPLSIAF